MTALQQTCMQQANERKAAGDNAGAITLMRQAKDLKDAIAKLTAEAGAAATPAAAAAAAQPAAPAGRAQAAGAAGAPQGDGTALRVCMLVCLSCLHITP
jgi:hypothetical protein